MKYAVVATLFAFAFLFTSPASAARHCMFPGEVANAQGYCAVPAKVKAVKRAGKHKVRKVRIAKKSV